MKENKILKALRSVSFIVYVALFTVLFLSPNTYYVYYSFCAFKEPYRVIASIGASLIIASFIMIFTLRKNARIAYLFSLVEIMISGYYYMTIIGFDWGLVPAFCFTMILPYAVYCSSTEIGRSENTAETKIKELEKYLNDNPDKRPSDFINGKVDFWN